MVDGTFVLWISLIVIVWAWFERDVLFPSE